jgi:predicted tellurium resistance membrane protein TerC
VIKVNPFKVPVMINGLYCIDAKTSIEAIEGVRQMVEDFKEELEQFLKTSITIEVTDVALSTDGQGYEDGSGLSIVPYDGNFILHVDLIVNESTEALAKKEANRYLTANASAIANILMIDVWFIVDGVELELSAK